MAVIGPGALLVCVVLWATKDKWLLVVGESVDLFDQPKVSHKVRTRLAARWRARALCRSDLNS